MSDQMLTLDGTQTEAPAAPAPSKRARKSTAAAAKLLQAAALAAVLVPLGSVPAEASTCTFDFSGSPSCGIAGVGADGFAFFGFADPTYKVALGFDEVHGSFDVEIIAHELDETAALAKLALFPGFRPVPIGSNPSAPFIDFEVIDHSNGPCVRVNPTDCTSSNINTWVSQGSRGPSADLGYNLRIYWTANTDPGFPHPHVFHADGDSDVYNRDISDPNFPYTTDIPKCSIFDCEVVDPAAGGRDDMFTTFGLADASVPEPTSLLLLGSGISGWLYRRRRQK